MTTDNGKKTITIALMDAPYESATTTTAMRVIDAALKKGINVNVFAYEGAVLLTVKNQTPHPNPVKGKSVEQNDHATTARFLSGLFKMSGESAKLDWVNCGMCVDERGPSEWIEGPRRGGPDAFWKFSSASTNTLVIGTH
jgi:tRNA 2-thiouridine synthesizing protein D